MHLLTYSFCGSSVFVVGLGFDFFCIFLLVVVCFVVSTSGVELPGMARL